MFFRILEPKPVEVANKGGKTGTTTYWAMGWLGKTRIRRALGTEKPGVADTRVEWIKRACEEGPDSPYWPQLRDGLPARSFEYFAGLVGYKEKAPEPPKREAVWTDLRASYVASLDNKILLNEFTESSKDNYLQSLRAFDAFLEARGIVVLSGMTEELILDEFRPWRLKSIQAKNNSKSEGKRLAFDLTVLRAAFNHTTSKAWGKAGFGPVENPIPKTKKDQKPGANPEDQTQPFSGIEIAKLRVAAESKIYSDSQGRTYRLEHGSDLLAFELLLRTGLRRCDAATIQWKHIRFDMGEGGMIRVRAKKNGKEVFLPIHPDLAQELRAERSRRNPSDSDTVLLNPYEGQPYDTKGKGLYRRMVALGERLEIEDVRPHRFRCSFAVDALMKGASPLQIADWLGDKVETVVTHYLPLSEKLSEQTRKLLSRRDVGLETAEHTVSLLKSQRRTSAA